MKRPTQRLSFLVPAFVALAALAACDSTPGDAQAAKAAPLAQPPAVHSKSYPLPVREGSVALFTVTVGGAQPMKYQWQREGVDIAGASERYYVVPSASLADEGAHFSVRISNAHGTIASDVGQLFVYSKDVPLPWF